MKIEDIESPKSRRNIKEVSNKQVNGNTMSYFNTLTKSKEERASSRIRKSEFSSPKLLVKKKMVKEEVTAATSGQVYKQKYLGYTKYGNIKSNKSKKNIKRVKPKRRSKDSFKDIRQQNNHTAYSIRNEIS